MSGYLSGFTKGILGVDNPDTNGFGASGDQARLDQKRYGAREASNYTQEQDLAGSLGATIHGTGGPSIAQTQLRAGLDQNNADALAAGAGASGVNSVLARYQARQSQGEQGARIQQAAAILRAQEVEQAQQRLAQLRAVMGQQSIGLYGGNLNAAMGYDQLKAQLDQQNAQRDTVLGAAGLSGAATLGSGLFSAFGGKGDSGAAK